ncbi:hypothetical protein NUM3379_16960 [Kineococcus sp. NUM-3379]
MRSAMDVLRETWCRPGGWSAGTVLRRTGAARPARTRLTGAPGDVLAERRDGTDGTAARTRAGGAPDGFPGSPPAIRRC